MVATGVSHVLVPLNRDLSPAVHFMQDMRDDVMSVTPDGDLFRVNVSSTASWQQQQ
jgi:hypothetical protein